MSYSTSSKRHSATSSLKLSSELFLFLDDLVHKDRGGEKRNSEHTIILSYSLWTRPYNET